jgi:hypothetical protein
MRIAHAELEKALRYSIEKYGVGNTTSQGLGSGATKTEPETRAAANQQLVAAAAIIEKVYGLLLAVDHEIKDYELEKKLLREQRDAMIKKTHAEFEAKIKALGSEVKSQEQQAKELKQKEGEEIKRTKEQFAAKIKEIEAKIKSIK